jgi:hypothetical protein
MSVDIRDRVRELVRVRADSLVPHPHNARTHGPDQRSAIRGVLEEVGYVDALIARKLPDGTLQLLDGHARREETPDMIVPVLLVELNDAEADMVLATFDPLGALARTDAVKQTALLESINAQDAEVRRLLSDIRDATENGGGSDDEPELEGADADPFPGMALQPHEHYDFLVVLCRSTHEWNVLCERLDLKPTPRRGKMGTSRAISAGTLLNLLTELAELREKTKAIAAE